MRLAELLEDTHELPLVIQLIHDLIDKGEAVAFYRGRTERDRRIYRLWKDNIKPFERNGKTGWRLDSPQLPVGTYTFIPDARVDSYQLEQHPTKEVQGKKVWMLLKPDQTIRKKDAPQ